MNREQYHRRCSPPSCRRLGTVMAAVTLLSILSVRLPAQDLVISGTVNNTGTIRVKKQTVIAQPAVGGVLELTGTDQTLPARQYQHVRLSGSGVKTLSGGNADVTGVLSIAAPVTLRVPHGNIITLGDSLNEAGVLLGAVRRTVDLQGSTTSSNFGNIGAGISWSSNAPGITSVVRASDSTQAGNGNSSVRRFYRITPTDTTAVGNVLFRFADAELDGHSVSSLELWHSQDNGASWRRRPAVVDALNRTIGRSNVPLAGLWAMADTTRPLGPLTAAGIPAYLATMSAPPPLTPILTALPAYSIVVTDAFGDPVANVPVSFALTSVPAGASGQSLSAASTTTDSLGRAGTQLTLGDKTGDYVVTVTSPSLNPVALTARAKHGAPTALTALTATSINDTVFAALVTPLRIVLTDIGGNAVDSTPVRFAFASVPSTASLYAVSMDSVVTDSSGRAEVTATLGNRPGSYIVTAAAGALTPVTFTITAARNVAAQLFASGGGGQSDTVFNILGTPMRVEVRDRAGHPVDSAIVQFAITAAPDDATGQSLSALSATADTSGLASVSLTLGSRTGLYEVSATSPAAGIAPVLFQANAVRGPAAVIQLVAGTGQNGVVGTELSQPFIVSMSDIGGNAAEGDSVEFAIVTAPDGAVEQRLSVTNTTVDLTGMAQTRLTLGTKTGTYTVRARSPKVAGTLFFSSTAIPGTPSVLAVSGGSAQSGQILTTTVNDIAVAVRDSLGNGIAGRTVRFSVTSAPTFASGQSVTDTIAVTDASGRAVTKLRFGSKTGRYIVSAVSTGLPELQVEANATPGAPAALLASARPQQSRTILSVLDTPFTVNVLDIGDNAVPGTTVEFSILSSPSGAAGMALSDTVSVTDSTGEVRSFFTLGSKVGLYEVLARIFPSPATMMKRGDAVKKKRSETEQTAAIETRFSVLAVAGAPAAAVRIVGDGQTMPTGAMLDTAFTLRITDIGLNAVPGAPVSFRIASAPAGAAGQALSDTLVSTDSAGVASVFLTLGDREGMYVVSAEVPGAAPVTFNASAFVLYGDVNRDIAVNIADITAYIDIILGTSTMTPSDSVKADVNKDGRVDQTDIDALKEVILGRAIPPSFLERSDRDGVPTSAYAVRRVRRTAPALFSGAEARLEATEMGLRLNVDNIVNVRGIEMRLRLTDSLETPALVNLQFSRGKNMDVFVKNAGNEVRLVAYDRKNAGLDAGTGPVFRLSGIRDAALIDTVQILFSVGSNISVEPAYTTATAGAGVYPLRFALRQNYPNPFNGSTRILYDIPDGEKRVKALLQVYNMLGQKVRTLVSREHDPGTYPVDWDGTDDEGRHVATGVYVYRLMTKDLSTARKLIYVK